MSESGPPSDGGADVPGRGVNSEVSGSAGEVLQARDIHGDVHFHGPADGPPPALGQEAPPRHVPRELPGDLRGFVNRLVELEGLDRLVAPEVAEPVRVLILTGTAGVGKTSLALHWAHRVRERFPDGQLYINLRGYDSGPPVAPEHVLDRFLRSLGLASSAIPADVEAMAATYRSLLAGRRLLLMLDNAQSPAQVRPLLPGAPGCFVVITSRSGLSGLAIREGALRLALEVFSASEAVALLRTVTSDYRPDDDPDELMELAGLCARLPLALRIAAEQAARRPRMRLEDLITDLRDESSLWEALSTEDDGESEAVRTVFSWSYRALPEDAARLFRLLGLHPGPDFSDHAAAALMGTATRRIRHVVDTLVGAHLVEQTAFDRYGFHDLLRAFAADQSTREETSDERLRVLRRVLLWYLHTADAAQTHIAPEDPRLPLAPLDDGVVPLAFASYDDAVRWYDAEHVNLLAATHAATEAALYRIAWQLALCSSYVGRSSYADWVTTSRIGLRAAHADGDQHAEAELHHSLGMAYMQSQRLDQGTEHYRAALALRRELGDSLGEALELNGLGLLSCRLRHLDEARAFYEQAADRLHELGDTYWEAVAAVNLGWVYMELDQLPEATERVLHALEVFRAHSDTRREGNALNTLSIIQRESGRPAEALDSAQRAVEIARDRDDPFAEGFWLIQYGHAQRAVGRPGDALVSYHRSADLHRRLGDRGREALAWDGTGLAYAELGRPGEAVPFHRLAAAVHRDLGDAWQLATALDHLAAALLQADDDEDADFPDAAEQARRHWRDALTALAPFDDPAAARMRARITTALDASPDPPPDSPAA